MRPAAIALLAAVVALAFFASGIYPLDALGAFALLAVGGVLGLVVLVAVAMYFHGLLFERRSDRWRRFN